MLSLALLGCQADVKGPVSTDPSEITQIQFSSDPTVLGVSTSFDMGYVPVGANTSKLIYVMNTGTRDISNIVDSMPITHFTYTGTGVFPGASGTCNSTLIEGAQCILDLTYTPTE